MKLQIIAVMSLFFERYKQNAYIMKMSFMELLQNDALKPYRALTTFQTYVRSRQSLRPAD